MALALEATLTSLHHQIISRTLSQFCKYVHDASQWRPDDLWGQIRKHSNFAERPDTAQRSAKGSFGWDISRDLFRKNIHSTGDHGHELSERVNSVGAHSTYPNVYLAHHIILTMERASN